MFSDTRYYEDNESVDVKFFFNKNLAIGFVIGTPIVLILIWMLHLWQDIAPEPRAIAYDYVPVTLLNFGNGDGTGVSKGNLTAEGIAHKGQTPATSLNDAEIATNTKQSTTASTTDITLSSNVQPTSDINSTDNNTDSKDGTSSKNVGTDDGIFGGRGLGTKGRGMGLGEGFGEIEWGGGGNRMVLSKKPPKFPAGAHTSGEILIRFRVKADGTISKTVILKKSDPAFESAAIEALRQWRFNPIKDSVEMEGIIPFRFNLR